MYGITGIALDILKCYLSNRTQSVKMNGVISPALPVRRGVPQGSILGPLLFLFFINDLPNISNNVVSILFADDTTLSFRGSSIAETNYLCSNELSKFVNWSTANKLSINKNKTYCTLRTYRRMNSDLFSISMNNHILKCVEEGLFLGVMIDKN